MLSEGARRTEKDGERRNAGRRRMDGGTEGRRKEGRRREGGRAEGGCWERAGIIASGATPVRGTASRGSERDSAHLRRCRIKRDPGFRCDDRSCHDHRRHRHRRHYHNCHHRRRRHRHIRYALTSRGRWGHACRRCLSNSHGARRHAATQLARAALMAMAAAVRPSTMDAGAPPEERGCFFASAKRRRRWALKNW